MWTRYWEVRQRNNIYEVFHESTVVAKYDTMVSAELRANRMNETIYYEEISKRLNMSLEDVQSYNPLSLAVLIADGNTYSQAKELLDEKSVHVHNLCWEPWCASCESYYGIDITSIILGKNKSFHYLEYDGCTYVIYYSPVSFMIKERRNDKMLSEREMQELSNLASKLSVEGYDVDEIKAILAAEREKINSVAIADLINYFPITDNIGVKLAHINYGYNKLTLNATITLERNTGVFDINSKPEMFESILRNALYNSLRELKEEYLKEVNELNPAPPVTTTITATPANPISFTIGTNVLYTEVGTIDTAMAWTVSDIKDSAGNSIDGNGVVVTATTSAPLILEVTDWVTVQTFNITSGTYDGTTLLGNNIILGGGE